MKKQIKLMGVAAISVAAIAGMCLLSCSLTEFDKVSPVSAASDREPYVTPVNIVESNGPLAIWYNYAPITVNDTCPNYYNKMSPVLVVHFNRCMRQQGTATLTKEGGAVLSPTLSWTIGSTVSTLTLTMPNLDTCSSYTLKLVGSTFVDVDGNMLSNDGDLIGGESPDDDFVFWFMTRGTCTNSGKYIFDTEGPVFTNTLYGANADNSALYTISNGSSVAVDVVFWFHASDHTFDNDSSNITTHASLDWNGMNLLQTGAIKLYRLPDSTTINVLLGTSIEYGDPAGYQYASLSVDPDVNLTPGVEYLIRVDLTKIIDKYGNKCYDIDTNNANRYFTRRFVAGNYDLDGNEVLPDGTPPAVFDWSNPYIIFSEVVTAADINSANITVWDAYGREIPAVLTIVPWYDYNPATTPITVVHIAPASTPSYVRVQTCNITDLAGNKGIGVYQDNW